MTGYTCQRKLRDVEITPNSKHGRKEQNPADTAALHGCSTGRSPRTITGNLSLSLINSQLLRTQP